ncbi:MAG: hypothetical protein PSX71_14040 [bacterium]|nr:hypothetical protein [bacterium]
MQLSATALNGLDDIGFLDFSALLASAGNVIQASAPKLLEAAVQQKLAAMTRKAAAPAPAAALPDPVSTAPVQRAAPVQKNTGIDKRILIGGGIGIAVVVAVLVLR